MQWKEIKGWPYKVNEHGQLWCPSTNRVVYNSRNMGQYPYFLFQGVMYPLHLLVAKAFMEPYNKDTHCVHHIDGNKRNCHLNNLQIVRKDQHHTIHAEMREAKRQMYKKAEKYISDIEEMLYPNTTYMLEEKVT